MSGAQQAPATTAAPSPEIGDAALPERIDPAASDQGLSQPETQMGAITPERHRAILLAAARNGSWESAERATRTVARQWLFAAIGRLLRRLISGRPR